MDYCPNGDLAKLLQEVGMFTTEEARFYFAEIVLSLEALHDANIIYRDLKPENILIDSDGHIKLADFGLSKELVKKEDVAKSFCGSPIYFSPELVSDKGSTQASDIYVLGLILYEMLVGEPPYLTQYAEKTNGVDNLNLLYKMIKDNNIQYPVDLDSSAKNLISSLLQKDPKKRLGVEDINQIKQHDFFGTLNWDTVFERKLKPPFSENQDLMDFPRRNFHHDDHDYETEEGRQLYIPEFDYVEDEEIDRELEKRKSQI